MDNRAKSVLPLANNKLNEYSVNGFLKFNAQASTKVSRPVIIFLVLWLIVLCIISALIIKETLIRSIVVCFFVLFIFLMLFLVNNTVKTSSILITRDKLEVFLQKKGNKKSICYRLNDVKVESRLSKNNDAITSVFYLIISSGSKKDSYRIDVGTQYNDYIAFMIVLFSVMENPNSPTMNTRDFDHYINRVLYKK